MIDDMDMGRRRLFLGGKSFKRLDVPPEIPERLKPWYRMRDFYIGKADPDYGLAFSGDLVKTVRSDFRALAPLYRMLRGCAEEAETSSDK